MSQRVTRKRVIVVTSDDEDGLWMNSQRQATSFSQCSQKTQVSQKINKKLNQINGSCMSQSLTQRTRSQTRKSSQQSQGSFLTTQREFTKQSSDSKVELNQSYADRFRPISSSELAVNPTKLQELTQWLKEAKSGYGRLLLTGPPGAGKSISVEVLCRSLDIAVQTYDAELLYEVNGFDGSICHENASKAFFDFMRKPRKTCGDERPVVLLIDSLPITNQWSFREFQLQLAQVLKYCKFSIVFCLTDDSSDYWHSYKAAFTSIFLNENNITSLNFLPIANRFMEKALNRICKILKLKINTTKLKDTVSIANGDIRAALNIIQFSLSHENGVKDLEIIHKGSFTSSIFHQIGSLLYAKREDLKEDSFETDVLPDRPRLKRDANEVLEMTNVSSSMVTSFLHEHEPNFSPSIRATRQIFDSFSLCDAITSRWEVRDVSEEYSAQICARNVQYYNYGVREKKSGAYTFSRPKYGDVLKEARANFKLCYEAVHMVDVAEAFSLVFPMLPWTRASIDNSQVDIISYLSRPMTFSRLAGYQQWKIYRSQQDPGKLPKGPLILTSFDGKSVLHRPDTIVDTGTLLYVDSNEDYEIDDSDDNLEADNELYDSFEDGY